MATAAQIRKKQEGRKRFDARTDDRAKKIRSRRADDSARVRAAGPGAALQGGKLTRNTSGTFYQEQAALKRAQGTQQSASQPPTVPQQPQAQIGPQNKSVMQNMSLASGGTASVDPFGNPQGATPPVEEEKKGMFQRALNWLVKNAPGEGGQGVGTGEGGDARFRDLFINPRDKWLNLEDDSEEIRNRAISGSIDTALGFTGTGIGAAAGRKVVGTLAKKGVIKLVNMRSVSAIYAKLGFKSANSAATKAAAGKATNLGRFSQKGVTKSQARLGRATDYIGRTTIKQNSKVVRQTKDMISKMYASAKAHPLATIGGGALFTIEAAKFVQELVGGYNFAKFVKEEAHQGTGFSSSIGLDALEDELKWGDVNNITPEDLEMLKAAMDFEDEVLQPEVWSGLIDATPHKKTADAFNLYFKGARISKDAKDIRFNKLIAAISEAQQAQQLGGQAAQVQQGQAADSPSQQMVEPQWLGSDEEGWRPNLDNPLWIQDENGRNKWIGP